MTMRIGILTGGGDCPGLNAVIRAVVKTAVYKYQMRVFGIEDGFQGLLEDRIGELTSMHVSGILSLGGTILGSNNKCNPSRIFVGNDAQGRPQFENRIDDCLRNIARHKLDALVIIGGDGTMTCAAPFVEAGIRCIGLPKTIDNDIHGTDVTFGFLTAVQIATDALDRLRTTAASHHRVLVCELMGRNAGWLTLHAGIASGADVILLPEIPFDLDSICRFVESRMHRGRGYSIVACAEGSRPIGGERVVSRIDPSSHDPIRLGGIGKWVADQVEQKSGISSRVTVLGHIQRGGSPIAADRVLATTFGHRAIELLVEGANDRLIVWQGGNLTEIDMREAAGKQRLIPLDDPLIQAARDVKTCFGDD